MGVKNPQWKTTGWGVVEYAEQMGRVDLILMDLRLPVEDGYEALRQIRAHPKLGDTLVVPLTALGSVSEMEKAREAGFDGFIEVEIFSNHYGFLFYPESCTKRTVQ